MSYKRLAEGTEVECVGDDPYYEVGRIYCVGYDREGEYGVIDDSGDVMSSGRMYSPIGRLCFFKEVDWKVVEPDTSNVETTLKIEEGNEPLTMEQLAAFVYGYSTAGGDMTKVVTLTIEGDK